MGSTNQADISCFYTANVLTIKTTGDLQGKSALSMEKGCKNCRVSPQFLQQLTLTDFRLKCVGIITSKSEFL